MFDEMLDRENLYYSQKFNCIEGFENVGSQSRTHYIANRVLVFNAVWPVSKKKAVSQWLTTLVVKALGLKLLCSF